MVPAEAGGVFVKKDKKDKALSEGEQTTTGVELENCCT